MVEYHRFSLDYLTEWKDRETRKPLVIRGARQVGKSFLVQMFAEKHFKSFLEINFEFSPEASSLFRSGSPETILPLLEAAYNTRIIPRETLLFLDEIQAAPDVFASLRYFHEKMPELHIISAGSLLEFVLKEGTFSMPVGRIEYLHLGPMRFEEFLLALKRDSLYEWLSGWSPEQEVPSALHIEALNLVKQYLLIGGLPEAVKAFGISGSLKECARVQQSVLSTFRDDFNKYAQRAKHSRVQKIFDKVPELIGKKFKYSHVDREERSRDLKPALELLSLARVIHPVYHTHANGIPLKAEINEKIFKVLFLDVGLLCRSLGLGILDLEQAEDILLINNGAVCEQFIGQELLYSGELFEEPQVFCWMREKKTSNAEVDYVYALGSSVFPVEVKAGKTGRLKSMHVFLRKKKRSFALRFNSEVPSVLEAQTNLADGHAHNFTLLSLPFYLSGQAARASREILSSKP